MMMMDAYTHTHTHIPEIKEFEFSCLGHSIQTVVGRACVEAHAHGGIPERGVGVELAQRLGGLCRRRFEHQDLEAANQHGRVGLGLGLRTAVVVDDAVLLLRGLELGVERHAESVEVAHVQWPEVSIEWLVLVM
jgi:hypothetical protein